MCIKIRNANHSHFIFEIVPSCKRCSTPNSSSDVHERNSRVSWMPPGKYQLIICTVFLFYGLMYNVKKMQMTLSSRRGHNFHVALLHKHHPQLGCETIICPTEKYLHRRINAIITAFSFFPSAKLFSPSRKIPDGATGILIDFIFSTEVPFRRFDAEHKISGKYSKECSFYRNGCH